jgi:hypothetical protein
MCFFPPVLPLLEPSGAIWLAIWLAIAWAIASQVCRDQPLDGGLPSLVLGFSTTTAWPALCIARRQQFRPCETLDFLWGVLISEVFVGLLGVEVTRRCEQLQGYKDMVWPWTTKNEVEPRKMMIGQESNELQVMEPSRWKPDELYFGLPSVLSTEMAVNASSLCIFVYTYIYIYTLYGYIYIIRL